ncbi:MAG: prolyl oligopeptidase family serine peptidase [Planctomycetota bacterium]
MAPPVRQIERAAALALPLLLACCASGPESMSTRPPNTHTVDVVDDYHGTQVADPYRWLEDLDAPEVRTWIEEQNAASRAFLAAIPRREALRQRLTELWNFPRKSPPQRAGQRWLWRFNDGLQNQPVLYVGDRPDDAGRILLDPNTLSSDGTVALGPIAASHDGAYLAFGTSKSGSDWTDWQVLSITDGRILDDQLHWTKFTSAAWTHDNAGFFYMRYPKPREGETYEARNQAPELCYHRLGDAQTDDEVVYARPDEPTWGFAAAVTDDGRYLVITIWSGTDTRNRVAYLDLERRDEGVQPLLMDFDANYAYAANVGTKFYFQTNWLAPRGRVLAIDLASPDRAAWQEVVPQQRDTLEGTAGIGGRLVLTYLRDAAHAVVVHALDGTRQCELSLPAPCSVDGVTGRFEDADFHFLVTSFLQPGAILRCDVATGAVTEAWRPNVPFDASSYVAEQVFYASDDGTRVPMFLVHARRMKLDGDNPTYLYGYGGFNVSLTPSFSTPLLAWLELGGVYAVPNLRGGGEYGEEWHQAGMRGRKQNVFDDFRAAARYLIRNGYTRPERLAVGGGSNGGLLVGAALTQFPELIAAAVPQVGVLDMLRYHHFTIGWAWAPEYGTADEPDMFPILHAYSPLHRVQAGRTYPATLVLTGDHDDRVLPAHSYKFAAALQAAQAGSAPILLSVDVRTGHGAGKPTSKLIAVAADLFAFLAATLGIRD